MHRDHDGSPKSWLREALSAFSPVNIARMLFAWIDATPAPIEIRARETRRRARRH